MKVIFRSGAINTLQAITRHITAKGYPETARKFVLRLSEFGRSLTNYADKYPICRYPRFASNGFRCAIFEHNYIFVYRVDGEKLIIYNVVHVKRLG